MTDKINCTEALTPEKRRRGRPRGPATRPMRPRGLGLEDSFRWFMPGDPPPAGECWPWSGQVNASGHGILAEHGRPVMARRVAYEIFNGPIPDGMVVYSMHSNLLDVNPHNLRLVTRAELFRIRARKSLADRAALRHHTDATGANAPRSAMSPAKLDADRVSSIRAAWATGGATVPDLAVRFGVSRATIYDIVQRRTWRWLD